LLTLAVNPAFWHAITTASARPARNDLRWGQFLLNTFRISRGDYQCIFFARPNLINIDNMRHSSASAGARLRAALAMQ
jgi:hypothetical protein